MCYLEYFQHSYSSPKKVTSHILIETLLDEDPEMLALYILHSSEEWIYKWYSKLGDDPHADLDKKRVAYKLACLDDLKKEQPGYRHHGDCTGASAPCSRCVAEIQYCEVLDCKNEYQAMQLQEDLLTILLGTDYLFYDQEKAVEEYLQYHRNDDAKEFGRIIQEAYRLYPLPDNDLKSRYPIWVALSDEKKEEARRRSALVRHYIQHRPVVQGIPWW